MKGQVSKKENEKKEEEWEIKIDTEEDSEKVK